jgi:uncharacterized protein YjiS (DUF1127 family)
MQRFALARCQESEAEARSIAWRTIFVRWLIEVLKSWQRSFRRSREPRTPHHLNDATLKDIGITRIEAEFAATTWGNAKRLPEPSAAKGLNQMASLSPLITANSVPSAHPAF